jgi:hypothetical protein
MQITYVKSGQGFDWNSGMLYFLLICALSLMLTISQDMFLPVHSRSENDDLAMLDQHIPVHEIHLPDEEDDSLYSIS